MYFKKHLGQGAIWIILIIAIVALIVLWISKNPATPISTTSSTTPETSVDESISTSPTSTIENSDAVTYSNTVMGFSVNLPKDINVDENIDGTVSFSKWGPTQKTATELYDGFAINVDQGLLEKNTDLRSFIEADIAQKTEQFSPDFKVVKAVTSWQDGFSYTVQDTFGELTYYYLPQDNNKFLIITITVKDPGELGFENITSDILSGIVMSN